MTMTRNISKSHLAKVFSRVGESIYIFFFGERSGERLNVYFCMNVHLLSEQLVAVTQKLDKLWKLDNLLLLRLLLLLLRLRLRLPLPLLLPPPPPRPRPRPRPRPLPRPLPLPLPLPLPPLLLLLLFLLLLWGVALPQNSTPQKAKVWRKFSSRLAKVHPATSDPQPIMSKFE